MTADELCFAPIAAIARRYRSRDLSPVEVARAVLDRVERVDPLLNAFTTVLGEHVVEEAKAAEARLREPDPPPLCGIPVSLKDNVATAGVRTTAGSRILSDWVPREDAACVTALRAAGATILGKTNLFEFAYGEAHPDFGHVRNPWDTSRSTAGSSTGSAAAVAAGLGWASIGTDTGGSIRVPAAMCGVVGLKPTYGAVSRRGIVSTTWSLCHVGPLARTVDDAAAVFAALAGEPRPDVAGGGAAGLRLAVALPQEGEALDGEVAAAVEAACRELERAGAQLVAVELPSLLLVRAVLWTTAAAEALELHHDWLRDRPHDYHPVVRARLERARAIPADAYVRAQRVRRRLADELDTRLGGVDALLLPVAPTTAYAVGARVVEVDGREEEVSQAVTRYTPLASLVGRPAASVPCGFARDGLPIGLQIVCRAGDEGTLFRVARSFEQATEWHLPRPPVAGAAATAA